MANLIRLGRVGACGLGLLMLVLFVNLFATETRLFTNPRFDGFWDDVESYHLERANRKTAAQLSRKYGTEVVVRYVLSPGLSAAYLPSEHATFVCVVAYSLTEARHANRLFLLAVWGTMLVGMYLPMIVAARELQRCVTQFVCRGAKARKAREDYFVAIKEVRLWAIAAVLGPTLSLCFANALAHISPELQRRQIGLYELTGWLVVMAIFSGLWMQLLVYAVDIPFLASGLNPHLTLWDELLVLAVMTPILVLVYHNSWLTIASIASAAFAAGLFLKWRVLRRGPSEQQQFNLGKVCEEDEFATRSEHP